MAVVVLDIPLFRLIYPQFSSLAEAQIRHAFSVACLLCDNSPQSALPFEPGVNTERETLLYLLTCHVCELIQRAGGAGAGNEEGVGTGKGEEGAGTGSGTATGSGGAASGAGTGSGTGTGAGAGTGAGGAASGASGLGGAVGGLTTAAQGSVRASFAAPSLPNAPWFAQTQCGLTYWQAVQKYAGGRYYCPC